MEYIYIIAILIVGSMIKYFQLKSNRHLKKEYADKKDSLFLKGFFVREKYFDKVGWKYRKISFLIAIVGVL